MNRYELLLVGFYPAITDLICLVRLPSIRITAGNVCGRMLDKTGAQKSAAIIQRAYRAHSDRLSKLLRAEARTQALSIWPWGKRASGFSMGY